MSVEAYPLYWPEGWPRTENNKRCHSPFRVTQDRAQSGLMREIKLLGGRSVVLSTNIRLRRDGMPYASQRSPEDRGVAVYFQYKEKPMVFACDKYLQIGDNIHAIGKTIEALRGIERWGASDMMERAFTGFVALENDTKETWQDVLQVRDNYTLEECELNYKSLARDAHPDKPGGSNEAMQKLNWARDCARRELS